MDALHGAFRMWLGLCEGAWGTEGWVGLGQVALDKLLFVCLSVPVLDCASVADLLLSLVLFFRHG